MRCSYSTLVKAKRAGRASSVKVQPSGTAVDQYQVSLGNRPDLRPVGVVGAPSWSEPSTQTETWVRVPRLSATCPRRVVVFAGGRGDINRTFEFGDEFDGAAIDTAKWTVTGTGVAAAGGSLTITGTTAGLVKSVAAFGPGYAVRAKGSHTRTPGSTIALAFMASGAAGQPRCAFSGNYFAYVDHYEINSQTAAGAEVFDDGTSRTGTSAREIRRNGSTSVIFTVDGVVIRTHTTRVPTDALPIYLEALGNVGAAVTAQWLFVRRYIAADPVAGTAKPSATNRALCKSIRRSDLIRACCRKV